MPSQNHNCIRCGKPIPSVHESRQGAQGLLCYEHFLQTAEGRQLLAQAYVPPKPVDTGAGGPGRIIDQIHFHHSASDSGNAASFRYYHSVVLGWGDIAYHAVVTNGSGGPDGEVQWGKDDSEPGYSVGVWDLNARCLAICMVGNFSPGRYPTPAQYRSILAWMQTKAREYGVAPANVRGHRFWNNNSSCPGFEDAFASQMTADVFAQDGTSTPQEESEMAFDTVPMKQSDGGTKFHGHYDNTYPGVRECWAIIEVAQADEAGKPWPFGSIGAVIYKTQGPKDAAVKEITIPVGDDWGTKDLFGPYNGGIEVDIPDPEQAKAASCYIRTVT